MIIRMNNENQERMLRWMPFMLDFLGNELQVGDRVVYFTRGTSLIRSDRWRTFAAIRG